MCIGGPVAAGYVAGSQRRPAYILVAGSTTRVNASARQNVRRAKRTRSARRGGKLMKHVLGGLALAFATMHAPSAQAQTYPDRPIKLLVPLAAASAVDVVARVVGEKMGEALGQRLYVENMPGAAGRIGMRAAAHAAPDGYTVLVANDSVLTMIPNMAADAGYDPVKEFVPVTQLVRIPLGLI